MSPLPKILQGLSVSLISRVLSVNYKAPALSLHLHFTSLTSTTTLPLVHSALATPTFLLFLEHGPACTLFRAFALVRSST